MAVGYSLTAINARLQAVADLIDGGATNGNLLLRESGTVLSTIQLASPCGTVNGGVLTFVGNLLDPSADATGSADNAIVQNGDGVTVVTGLTIGIPLSGRDIILNNGLGSTVITAGQTVALLAGQITGS